MATHLRVSFAQLPGVFQQYGRNARAEVVPAVGRLAKQAGLIINSATRTAKPASKNGGIGAVNYGDFIRAWRADPVTLGGRYGVLVSNNSDKKALTIEYGGTWPNKAPPKAAIAHWAVRKFGIPYEQAERIAFPIARAIKRRGLRPRKVLTGKDTEKSFVMAMRQVFTQALSNASKQLRGGP